MTRNYVALFISTVVVLVSLFEGVFGYQGVWVNTHLARELEMERQSHEMRMLEMHNLESRLSSVWDRQDLLDDARVMGYVERGETVYYFLDDAGKLHPNASLTKDSPRSEPNEHVVRPAGAFTGLPRIVNMALALITTIATTIIIRLLAKRRRRMVMTIKRDQGGM